MREERQPHEEPSVGREAFGDEETPIEREGTQEGHPASEPAERHDYTRRSRFAAARRYEGDRDVEQASGDRGVRERDPWVRDRTGVGPDIDVPARIYLQPIASPTILGLFALGAAAFVYGAWMAGWYGGDGSQTLLFPFLGLVGGLAQLLAGMWAYRARDGLATLVFGTVGAFWLAYGLLHFAWLFADAEPIPVAGNVEFGFWLIPVALILGVAAAAAYTRSITLVATFGVFALGLVLLAAGQIAANSTLLVVSGWLLVIAAVAAAYTGAGLLLNEAMQRELLPLATRPGVARIESGYGEPGVMQGDSPSDELAEHREGGSGSKSKWEFQWPVRRRAA